MRTRYLGLFALSAATLMYELALTRVFAVGQGYHFAFLSLSLALLGFGASGAWLARDAGRAPAEKRLGPLAAAAGAAIAGSYLVTNELPFDAYTLAWDRRQFLLLALNYGALLVPFLLSGLATGLSLSAWPAATSRLYAASLAGSAAGSLAALGALAALGGAGTIFAAASVAWLAAGAFAWAGPAPGRARSLLWLGVLTVLLGLAVRTPARLDVRLSPYKPLSYALRYPGARISFQRWNAYSRLDVVESQGVRSAPGLSLRYPGQPPEQIALTVDGGDLSAITRSPSGDEAGFLQALQGSLPHRLRPGADVLVLDPRGGLELLLALRLGARRVEAVVPNPLVLDAVRGQYDDYAGHVYSDRRVRVQVAGTRAYLARAPARFDLVVVALTQAYRPVTAGSYALGEQYLYTVESFQAALRALAPDGLLVVQGWLQSPPTETVRLLTLAGAALQRLGVADPRPHVVACRDWALATVLVRRTPFAPEELALVRQACQEGAFDLIAAPDLTPPEANRYHLLASAAEYQVYAQVLDPQARPETVRSCPYDVSPTTDERPFFGHTFRLQQLPAAWQRLGRSVEPFGGGGYLVLLALLALALVASAALVGFALARARRQAPPAPVMAYFLLIGGGYITVELVLMQRCILLLDQPTYAFVAVMATLLLASGLGSTVSRRLPLAPVLGLLALLIGALAWAWPLLAAALLGAPLAARVLAVAGLVAPIGLLMGVPFPAGMSRLVCGRGGGVAAAWAVNGCASVLGSILVTVAVLAQGFAPVLSAGGLAYLLALAALLAGQASALRR